VVETTTLPAIAEEPEMELPVAGVALERESDGDEVPTGDIPIATQVS